MILILLGGGVVANFVLNKSKGQSSGHSKRRVIMKKYFILFLLVALSLTVIMSGCLKTAVPTVPSESLTDQSEEIKVISQLSASPTSVNSGQTITVTFSGAPGNQKDFIALYKVGVPNGQPYVSYQFLKGQTSGTLYFTAPSTAGKYEFRMFRNNTWVYLGKSNPVTVTQSSVSLSASPTSVSPGQTITVTFFGAPGNQKDFIALYKVGVPNGQPYVSYQFLKGQTSGTLSFTAPSTAGDYEFRMFKNNDWVYLGKSNTVEVIPVSLDASPTLVSPGQSITVTFFGAPGNQKDFIALYKVGVPNGQPYVSYQFLNGQTSGTLSFTAPSTVGDYEFRMFKNNDWVYLGKSNPVIVSTVGLAEWTVMVYMSGDNTLDSAAWNDLGEMEDVGSTGQVRIVAQLDPYTPSSCTGTYRYYVTGTAAQGTSYPEYPADIVDSLSEQDMADPSVLGNFVNWATTNYPADHYLLVFWDHGGGWREEGMINKGVMVDDTSGTFMDMVDLADALDLINEHIDIIGFDACLMQMIEVAYQIESSVTDVPDYMVGSEDSEWNDGWPYDDFLSHLTSNPTMSAATLGETIVDDYVNSGPTNATLSLIDLNDFSSIADPIFTAFQIALKGSTHQTKIAAARVLAQNYAYSNNYRIRDIYDFAERIYMLGVYDCQAEANAVMNFVDNVVVYEGWVGPDVANSHGLSIYLPDDKFEYDSAYDTLLFNVDTNWQSFLESP